MSCKELEMYKNHVNKGILSEYDDINKKSKKEYIYV